MKFYDAKEMRGNVIANLRKATYYSLKFDIVHTLRSGLSYELTIRKVIKNSVSWTHIHCSGYSDGEEIAREFVKAHKTEKNLEKVIRIVKKALDKKKIKYIIC